MYFFTFSGHAEAHLLMLSWHRELHSLNTEDETLDAVTCLVASTLAKV